MSNNTGIRSLSPRELKYVAINSSATAIDLVEAVSGRYIAVVSLVLSTNGAADLIFRSDDNELGRVEFKATDPPLVLGDNPNSWFQTNKGEKLNIGNTSTLAVKGFLTYMVI